ncbi:hypothetical protein QLQ15_09560 [Lysobacter sp. LF1]|uniref:Secreted protein n=1 Tax=Lysobacter stagni TaxID=3045172 RepID=A0ABT6XG78_9GAMM|nr:hypothetical protein [Lysobacter sp. LF1]MDI9239156.1 hypothetical protein [Lysobacter sp. LF1]
MKRFLVSAVLALCCALPSLALAQASYVRIEDRLTPEQLQSVGLTPAQLERLNQLLRESQERAPTVAPATATAASVAAPRADATHASVATPERDDAGREADRSSLIGFNDEPIRSRLKGSVSEWSPGTVFELENGQQWKVLKGHLKLPKTLDAPEIVVVPGIAGRWFLQVDESMPKARVYRID